MLPIKSTAATCNERTIGKKRKIYYITRENIFKFILKFCFLLKFHPQQCRPQPPHNSPKWKFQKFHFLPSSPPPLILKKFQFPLDFVELNKPVLPSLHKVGELLRKYGWRKHKPKIYIKKYRWNKKLFCWRNRAKWIEK